MPLTGDNASVKCFAFALISPPSASPGYTIRRALEVEGGNPSFGLAVSHYGAMMVIFPSQEVREATINRGPLSFDGFTISLERPEAAGNRVSWGFASFAQVSAYGFPLEHWSEGGIRTAFRPIGSICCIDPLCLNELDYSAVRLIIHLANGDAVPQTLLLRDFEGETSTLVRLEVIRCWPSVPGSFSYDGHYACGGICSPRGGGPAPGGGGRRMDDIDSSISEPSAGGSPPSPAPAAPSFAASPSYVRPISPLELWSRIVARRAGDIAKAGCLPGGLCSSETPVELWDQILARRLSLQFPEVGLSADQVNLLETRPSSSCCPPILPSQSNLKPPLLLQWHDTLAVPATPLVPGAPDGRGSASPVVDSDASVVALPDPAPAGDGFIFSGAGGEEHEDAARKRRVRNKRAADSAFKARHSSRLASKEPTLFADMLSRAKNAKASRFDASKGSPRLRAAIAATGIDDGVPDFMPLQVLQGLGEPYGVDPAALESAASVPRASP
jgi:hypothetical protein